MKLILFSDTHLGFGLGTEREQDPFLTFEEGIEKATHADALILAGDLFDTRTPTPETFSRSMESLLKLSQENPPVEVSGISKEIKPLAGIPVIALHGNHERRVRGLVNPVEALEKGGFMFHLHCNGILLKTGGEQVAIQGMSAVPDKYASQALKEWAPSPVPGAYNILLIHQTIEGFIRAPGGLPKQSLPEGFDLYICGDIHESRQSEAHGSPLLFPGSSIATQITKDSQKPRLYWEINTTTSQLNSIPFKRQRTIHYKEFKSEEEARTFLKSLPREGELKPIVKLQSPLHQEEVQSLAGSQALLHLSKETPQAPTRQEQALSVQESGRKLLENNLKQFSLDPKTFETIFELLLEKKREEALKLLRKQAKNIHGKENSGESGPPSPPAAQPRGSQPD
ncbi:MAG: DNA repair exonuclease [Candidatus Aenigmarchaeota archaeon]|nr:DNA repair exonuclease [Candidatus Aenigmarchaeota archaeon]